jgi:hypothetical protein
MPWYCRVRSAINTAMPFLVTTQATNLALSSGERYPKEANPLPL